jgi:hypothetical protein
MAVKAKESNYIKKLRKKLKKQLTQQEKDLNEVALRNMKDLIVKLIERQKPLRIDLKDKTITLFDQNRHSAEENKAILKLKELVKKDYFHQQNEPESPTSLPDAPQEPEPPQSP